MESYTDFLENKRHSASGDSVPVKFMPDGIFPFQAAMVEWALSMGRAALYEDCGLGKTLQQLTWAENVSRHTNARVLVLTPLAVASQTCREAEKFGIEAKQWRGGALPKSCKIVVTNYEQLSKLEPKDFKGVVCDESSILKSFSGKRRGEITRFMTKMPYRLLATATAAPNDYTELGTSSEALGGLGYMDMLNRFFKNDQNNSATGRIYGESIKWRLKGHAETPFWRWICSWARALRKPSDLGFSDDGFDLPPLVQNSHIIKSRTVADGFLFAMDARNLEEQRAERRRTIPERCEKVAEMSSHDKPVLIWCHLNDEADMIESMIGDCVQVSGKDSDAAKEKKFVGFADGDFRALVTKPKIGAWGLNFQHCAHVVCFPSHSYEQYYQGVRRCWRFGQDKPVNVDTVCTEGEIRVLQNMERKSKQADAMFDSLISEMKNSMSITVDDKHSQKQEKPSWL